MKWNRYYTERAEDYWNGEYLDYENNNWYSEQHFVRIMIPILEKMLTENYSVSNESGV